MWVLWKYWTASAIAWSGSRAGGPHPIEQHYAKWSCDPEVDSEEFWPFEFDKMVAESSQENNISRVSSEVEYLKEQPMKQILRLLDIEHYVCVAKFGLRLVFIVGISSLIYQINPNDDKQPNFLRLLQNIFVYNLLWKKYLLHKYICISFLLATGKSTVTHILNATLSPLAWGNIFALFYRGLISTAPFLFLFPHRELHMC